MKTLASLRLQLRVAALVGDLATDSDAKRLGESGVPVRQIVTGTVCHLETAMVETALDGWTLDQPDGELECPPVISRRLLALRPWAWSSTGDAPRDIARAQPTQNPRSLWYTAG